MVEDFPGGGALVAPFADFGDGTLVVQLGAKMPLISFMV